MRVILRRALIAITLLTVPLFGGAGDVEFSLNIVEISLEPRPDPRKEARLAEWNSPMGRLMAVFQQQQAWVMRGTQPGLERVNGLAVRVKMQEGLPLELIAATVDAGIDLSAKRIEAVDWPWDEEGEPAMSLERQLSVLLGRRLTASH